MYSYISLSSYFILYCVVKTQVDVIVSTVLTNGTFPRIEIHVLVSGFSDFVTVCYNYISDERKIQLPATISHFNGWSQINAS